MLMVFLGVAFFGFISMNHEAGHHLYADSGCPIFGSLSSDCPQDAFGMVSKHLSAFQTFLSVIFSLPFVLFILIVSVTSVALLLFYPPIASRFLKFGQCERALFLKIKWLARKKIFSWQALLENSPNFV